MSSIVSAILKHKVCLNFTTNYSILIPRLLTVNQTFLQFKKNNPFAYGLNEDPYHEVIPESERKFWQRGGARRTKGIPPHIPTPQSEKLKQVQRMAYYMDMCFTRIGFKVGMAGLIRIIPAVGDIAVLIMNLYLFRQSRAIDGLPIGISSRMLVNITVDFLFGMIPFVGDLVSIGFRADTRNFILVRDHLALKYPGGVVDSRAMAETAGIATAVSL